MRVSLRLDDIFMNLGSASGLELYVLIGILLVDMIVLTIFIYNIGCYYIRSFREKCNFGT